MLVSGSIAIRSGLDNGFGKVAMRRAPDASAKGRLRQPQGFGSPAEATKLVYLQEGFEVRAFHTGIVQGIDRTHKRRGSYRSGVDFS